MEYLKKKFSVSYGSKSYRDNWVRIFQKFDALQDCPHAERCTYIDSSFCDADCEMISWTEKEWNLKKKGERCGKN